MALVQTLISGAGPLPLSQTFNAEGDGDVVFYLSGSAWSQTPGGLGIQLMLDGQLLGVAEVMTNEGVSHKALVPVFLPTTLTAGSHTVTLEAANSTTISDYNDNFQVVLIY